MLSQCKLMHKLRGNLENQKEFVRFFTIIFQNWRFAFLPGHYLLHTQPLVKFGAIFLALFGCDFNIWCNSGLLLPCIVVSVIFGSTTPGEFYIDAVLPAWLSYQFIAFWRNYFKSIACINWQITRCLLKIILVFIRYSQCK